MASLVWDEIGERIFQTGVDRGVLYLQDGTAVVWNGLTNVEESSSSEIKNFHFDGILYLKSLSARDFSAKLKALTYPDEFDMINGIAEASMGVVYYDQASQSFNLSYRTKIGNDIDGIDHGYKIHILYDVIAIPDSYGFDGISDSAIQPIEFGWTLSGTPQKLKGFKPTVHASVDSTKVPSSQLSAFEKILYGSDVKAPYLPSIEEISKLFGNLAPNPAFEVDKNNWDYQLSDGATLLDFTISPKWSKFGAMSAHFKWQNANDTTLRAGQLYTKIYDILPHVPYTATVHIKMVDPSSNVGDVLMFYITWYDADDNLIGPASFGSLPADESIVEGTRLVATGFAPADVHYARLELEGYTNVANDIIEFYIDGAQFEIGEEVSPYSGVQLPVRNLLPNPSFGRDESGWNRSVGSGATVDDFQVSDKWSKFGSRSLHFEWHGPNDSTTRYGQIYSTTGADGIPVFPGVPYTASVYLKTINPSTDLGAAGGYSLQIQWYDITNAQIGSGPVSTLADEGADGVRMTVTGVAPATAVAAAVFVSTTINHPNDTVEFYMDGAQFEIGSVASPFTDEVLLIDNLIPNSSFEVDISGWSTAISSGGTLLDFSMSTSWYKHGSKCAHFKWQNANDTVARTGVIFTPKSADGIPVLPNTFYTFSIYVKTVDPSQPTGTTYGYRPQITWYDIEGFQIDTTVESSYSDENVNTNGARLLVGSCSPPGAAYASVSLSTSTNIANDIIEIYIDAAQFEIGPIASAYLNTVSPDTPQEAVLTAEFSMTML